MILINKEFEKNEYFKRDIEKKRRMRTDYGLADNIYCPFGNKMNVGRWEGRERTKSALFFAYGPT